MNSKEIILFLETKKGTVKEKSKNLIYFISSLLEKTAFTLNVLVMSDVTEKELHFLKTTPVEKIYQLNLKKINEKNTAYALTKFLQEFTPAGILFAQNFLSEKIASSLSAKLQLPFFPNTIKISNNGNLYFYKEVFQGKLNQVLQLKNKKTFVATLIFSDVKIKNYPTKEIQTINLNYEIPILSVLNYLQKIKDTPQTLDLKSAPTVIGIGRGVATEILPQVYELATLLCSAVGGSKPVIEANILVKEKQIGQTGEDLSAKIYLALGISGQIQHLQGIQNVKNILAINKDPYAPIFKYADLGIVAKVEEIIPELVKNLKKTYI